jgi:hypothetical protein
MPHKRNRSRSPKRHVEPTYLQIRHTRPPPLDISSYSVSTVRALPSGVKKSPATVIRNDIRHGGRHGAKHEGSAFPIGVKEAFSVHH